MKFVVGSLLTGRVGQTRICLVFAAVFPHVKRITGEGGDAKAKNRI